MVCFEIVTINYEIRYVSIAPKHRSYGCKLLELISKERLTAAYTYTYPGVLSSQYLARNSINQTNEALFIKNVNVFAMPTALEYQKRIEQYDQSQIERLWVQISERNPTGWEPGKAFEYLILRAFQLRGAEVRYPYRVQLHGEVVEEIDGAIYWNHMHCIIECKDYQKGGRVSFEPIAKLRNQLMRRPASTIGCLFSTTDFTDPAITLASFTAPQTILLWNAQEIDYSIKNSDICRGLELKYRAYVEEGEPNFNILNRFLL